MAVEVNCEALIEAMDGLGLTPEEAAGRMNAPIDLIEGVCAGRVTRIPRQFRDAAADIIDEARLNGVAAGFIPPDDPIRLSASRGDAPVGPGNSAPVGPKANDASEPRESDPPAGGEPDEAPGPAASLEEIEGAEQAREAERKAARAKAADDLVTRTRDDRSAPFAPEALELLEEMRREDLHAFVGVRLKLQQAGFRGLTELSKALNAIEAGDGEERGRKPNQADNLIALTSAAELFRAPDGVGYADIMVDGHRETWAIASTGFRRWLTRRYYETYQGAPSSEALQSALALTDARAQYDAPERTIHVRVGWLNGKLYLDLCDKAWRVVEVDANGWRVINNPPVRFRRSSSMLPLPAPEPGASIEDLRPFINVQSDEEFVLAVAWVLSALSPGPYPLLEVGGPQGTAKSTLCWVLRTLIDPNVAPLRALPREQRDLCVAASNSHIQVFDNLSSIPKWISDTLCRLAMGEGFSTRQLYTDQDEVVFQATKPIMLTGIGSVVREPDLVERSSNLILKPIEDQARRTEAEFKKAFEAGRPRLLGALLNVVVIGLQRLPTTAMAELPRMADAAQWVNACESGFTTPGAFKLASDRNQDEAALAWIEDDLVASTVRTFLGTHGQWEGTATELLKALPKPALDQISEWPKNSRALSARLNLATPPMKKIGIGIKNARTAIARKIMLFFLPPPNKGAFASQSSNTSFLNNSNNLTPDATLSGGDASPSE